MNPTTKRAPEQLGETLPELFRDFEVLEMTALPKR